MGSTCSLNETYSWLFLIRDFNIQHKISFSTKVDVFVDCTPKKNDIWKFACFFNSLWPSDAMWRHRSGLIVSEVMACCLMAPSHYLTQCWLIIRGVLWHSPECKFIGTAQDINSKLEFENYTFEIIFKSLRGQWVKDTIAHNAILREMSWHVRYLFPLLSSGWVIIAVCDSVSVQRTKY